MLNRWNFLKTGFYERINIEIEANVEGGDSSALPYRVHSHREVNIDTVQKPSTRD